MDISRYAKLAFVIYFIVNLIGLFCYFVFDTNISTLAHEEQRDYYDGIDGISYFCTAIPVLLSCLMVNACWGIKALIDIIRRKDFRALIAGTLMATIWGANICVCDLIAGEAIKNGINHYE